jgi:uncharacterized protein (DUF2236 family)
MSDFQRSARNEPARDYGLFGPASVTWRIMSEPVMWVAGVRALYLQALHPRVMRGTWQNSSFTRSKEAWGRFIRTIEFVRVRTYGTLPEVERAGRRLQHVHASLRGVDEDGREFRLDEPELLLWVHCAEISSEAEVARRSGLRVTAAELDRFVAEQRRSAEVVGLDAAIVPGSLAELDEYFEQMRPQLRACPEARRALRLSFTPHLPLPLLPLRLVVPPLNALAFASLPAWARHLYGTPGLPVPVTDVAATAALRATFESTSRIPPQLLFVPGAAFARHAMRAAAA